MSMTPFKIKVSGPLLGRDTRRCNFIFFMRSNTTVDTTQGYYVPLKTWLRYRSTAFSLETSRWRVCAEIYFLQNSMVLKHGQPTFAMHISKQKHQRKCLSLRMPSSLSWKGTLLSYSQHCTVYGLVDWDGRRNARYVYETWGCLLLLLIHAFGCSELMRPLQIYCHLRRQPCDCFEGPGQDYPSVDRSTQAQTQGILVPSHSIWDATSAKKMVSCVAPRKYINKMVALYERIFGSKLKTSKITSREEARLMEILKHPKDWTTSK